MSAEFKKIPVQQMDTVPSGKAKALTSLVRGIERFMAAHRDKLNFIHMLFFVGFLILTIVPVFLPEPLDSATPTNNLTEFSLFMIWGIWFPVVLFSVIFTGRSWCGVLCPMGAASQWANRVGLKRRVPGWLRWEGTPIVSFTIVTILGQTLDVRDQPSGLAEVFLGSLLLAVMIGFVYGQGKTKRAWCRHVCPIGLLLGVFSRLSVVDFKAKMFRRRKSEYSEQGACPTMIAISSKTESRHCIQCFRCVNPDSPGGLTVTLRAPGKEIEQIEQSNANGYEVLFIFLANGLALGGFLWLVLNVYQVVRQNVGGWFIDHGWYGIGNAGPAWLMSVHPAQGQAYNWLDFIMIVGFMLSYMLASLLVLSLCTYLSAIAVTSSVKIKERFIRLGYVYAPVAMMSIVIGLGEKLFGFFVVHGVSDTSSGVIKGVLLLSGLVWSIYIAWIQTGKLSGNSGSRLIAMLPLIIGIICIVMAWYPSIFGTGFSVLEQYRHNLVSVQ